MPAASLLVVEDDDDLRRVVAQALRKAGYAVEDAPNGARAQRLVAAEKPDLVITDMLMPERDGVELIISLRELKQPPRILAISGGGQMKGADLLHLARKLGADATLLKPFSIDELLQAVAGLVGAASPAGG